MRYGLTVAISTKDLAKAHHAIKRVQSNFIRVNNVGPHFLGAGYGGYWQSGIVREESIEEVLSFAQSMNINIAL